MATVAAKFSPKYGVALRFGGVVLHLYRVRAGLWRIWEVHDRLL